MASSDERKISICLRKCHLDEMENEFISQFLKTLPDLQEEDRQQSLKILQVLKESRSAYTELQHLNYEQGRLLAKRVQKQREVNDLNKTEKELNEQCSELEKLIEQEKIAMDQLVSEYEVKMKAIIERCHQNANIYDEEIMKDETKKANKILSDLLAEEKMKRAEIVELKQTLDNMNQDVPDNMPEILGETELKKKLNSLTNKYSQLKKKY